MYRYTLCFINRGTELLMINRNKQPEMGVWNGVGGKIEPSEIPEQCVLREVFEETNIRLEKVSFTGTVTWINPVKGTSGMHVFLGEVSENYEYSTPVSIDEGILEWKEISWVLDSNNRGISNRIQEFLPLMIDGYILDHRYTYDQDGTTFCYEQVPLNQLA
ncbi:8-oxo-dGTP diphosphatase [Paenibacillus solanacearum]|uniref:8-oxo-dGTP diphosphatase n=1 Tax=Paenibacillus solanacearum TaxID=2048548 RepID=A0A916K9A3_9BACL|nr:8-oxo-dGTP diphosphatase [Paenibacillus solanacearum]CAG7652197.1 8-oxo-dGTP diphosphatase [Paenibacillus solanacearum]